MRFLITRKLKKLIKGNCAKSTICGEIADLTSQYGFPQFKSTEKFFFSDILAAYRRQVKSGVQIEGLNDLLDSMARKGGSEVCIHNFRIQGDSWSLITDGGRSFLYGVIVYRQSAQQLTLKQQLDDDKKQSVIKSTRNYRLKIFKERQLAENFKGILPYFDSAQDISKVSFQGIFSSDHPQGRMQSKTYEEILTMTHLGKEPVAVEMSLKNQSMLRVGGSGNRISLVAHAMSQKILDQVIDASENNLDLELSEFEF